MNVISVVDDDASVRLATVDLLNSHGFACEAYASAEEYLASPRTAHTPCLILDIHLPGLNGLELQRHLAQTRSPPAIIFITAFPEERARTQAMSAGASGFLPKPYSEEELLLCIRQALGYPSGQ
jgi:FixJ family two-component response regulator